MYRSSNIVWIIKTRRLKWAEHIARKEDRNAFKILTGKLTGKRPIGNLDVDGRAILE